MRKKDDVPSGIKKLLLKVGKRKSQDIERGIDEPGLLFPATRHEISKDDLRGDPKKLGKISLAPFDPYTPEAEQKLARYFLRHFQKWLLGKRLPQKRVRPNHKRDRQIVEGGIHRKVVNNSSSKTREITAHSKMDDMVFKETENIVNDKEFTKRNKMARKRLIQAKYRYPKTTTPSKMS